MAISRRSFLGSLLAIPAAAAAAVHALKNPTTEIEKPSTDFSNLSSGGPLTAESLQEAMADLTTPRCRCGKAQYAVWLHGDILSACASCGGYYVASAVMLSDTSSANDKLAGIWWETEKGRGSVMQMGAGSWVHVRPSSSATPVRLK